MDGPPGGASTSTHSFGSEKELPALKSFFSFSSSGTMEKRSKGFGMQRTKV